MKVAVVILFGVAVTVAALIFADAWLPESFLGFVGAVAAVALAIGVGLGWFLRGLFVAVETGQGYRKESEARREGERRVSHANFQEASRHA